MVYIQIPPHPVFGQSREVVKTILRKGIVAGIEVVSRNVNHANELRRGEPKQPAGQLPMRSFDELKAKGNVKINWRWSAGSMGIGGQLVGRQTV